MKAHNGTLKITPADYSRLAMEVQSFTALPKTRRILAARAERPAEFSAERNRWDVFHAAVTPETRRALYAYLSDDHIDTALRWIFGGTSLPLVEV